MDKRHKTILISIFIVVSLISLMDILFLKSHLFGSEIDYISGNYSPGLWPLFFKMSISLMLIFSTLYFIYYRHDISESIAIFLGSYTIWAYAGVSDLLFFWYQFQNVPSELPWLSHNVALAPVANVLGYTTITNTSLYVSVIIGIILVYYMTRVLKEKF